MDGHHVEPVNQIRLIACPCIFSTEKDRIDRYVPEGGTVDDHLRGLGWETKGLSARVFIDGEFIPDSQWEYAVPRAGQSFVARVIPMGGGGGQGKDAGRMVAMIAVMVLAMVATAYGGPLAGMAVMMLGTILVNALVPPPLPRRPLPLQAPQRNLLEAA